MFQPRGEGLCICCFSPGTLVRSLSPRLQVFVQCSLSGRSLILQQFQWVEVSTTNSIFQDTSWVAYNSTEVLTLLLPSLGGLQQEGVYSQSSQVRRWQRPVCLDLPPQNIRAWDIYRIKKQGGLGHWEGVAGQKWEKMRLFCTGYPSYIFFMRCSVEALAGSEGGFQPSDVKKSFIQHLAKAQFQDWWSHSILRKLVELQTILVSDPLRFSTSCLP